MIRWTDEQAAGATIEVLSEDFEVATLRSWFKPDPGQEEAGPSEWVARRDHARGMLQVGRALLALRARLAAVDGVVRAAVAQRYCCDYNDELACVRQKLHPAVDAMPADVRKHYSLDAPQ